MFTEMPIVIRTCAKYVQGKDAYKDIAKHAKPLSDGFCVLVDPFMMNIVKGTLEKSFSEADIQYQFIEFGGESSQKEVDRVAQIVVDSGLKGIMGVGGGKTLDTAKIVANKLNLPMISSPTSASSDAPCSGMAVVYSDDGVVDHYEMFSHNPELVYIDSQVVANGPSRLLVAGIGDALATFYEGRCNLRSYHENHVGGRNSLTSQACAKLCLDTIFAKGYEAKIACDKHVVTEALENIIEANTYLSGFFESCGGGGAHSVHNGLTILPETHKYYHGEKVAFGTIVLMVLENDSYEEINEVIKFCKKIGLPTCLKDLDVIEDVENKMRQVAKLALAPDETIWSLPIALDEDKVYSAIMVADQLGQ